MSKQSYFARQLLTQESVGEWFFCINCPKHQPYVTKKKFALVEEPWGDAIICQPYNVEQILLAENSSCLAVHTLLAMLGLEYTTKTYANAEFMSPGGHRTKLPILRLGAFVVSEFEPIASFIETKVPMLSSHLNEDDKLDMRAYITLAENILTNAELYMSWIDKEVLEETTKPRYGSVYPWPLSVIQCRRKRQQVLQQLKVYEWKSKSLEEVLDDVKKLCETLISKLDNNTYFYGDKVTELDALIFGHLFTILTTQLPNNVLAQTVNKYTALVDYCKRVEDRYFTKKNWNFFRIFYISWNMV